MPDPLGWTPAKARRLVTAVVNVDSTLAHVDQSLEEFDRALIDFRSLLVDFAAVLDRFGETLDRFGQTAQRVDGTVDNVGVITAQLADVVGEMGGITQTFSPAVAVNDQFRRQLEKLRALAGSSDREEPAGGLEPPTP